MSIQRLTPGTNLTGIPAATWNAFCESAEKMLVANSDYSQATYPRSIVFVQLPEDAAPGACYVLGDSLYDPADAQSSTEGDAIKARLVHNAPALEGRKIADVPADELRDAVWCVTLSGGEEDDLVPAAVSGVVAAKVQFNRAEDAHAAPAKDSGKLEGNRRRHGAAIIWSDSASYNAGSGERWALLRLGAPEYVYAGPFAVSPAAGENQYKVAAGYAVVNLDAFNVAEQSSVSLSGAGFIEATFTLSGGHVSAPTFSGVAQRTSPAVNKLIVQLAEIDADGNIIQRQYGDIRGVIFAECEA